MRKRHLEQAAAGVQVTPTLAGWVGISILVVIAIASIVWLSVDPGRTPAWAALTAIIAIAGHLAGV